MLVVVFNVLGGGGGLVGMEGMSYPPCPAHWLSTFCQGCHEHQHA